MIAELGLDFVFEIGSGRLQEFVESLIAGQAKQADAPDLVWQVSGNCLRCGVDYAWMLQAAANRIIEPTVTLFDDIGIYEEGDFIYWSGLGCHS